MSTWLKCRQCVVIATGIALYVGTMGVATTTQPAGAVVVSAKAVAANTYKLSGAVTGTLHDGPDAGCPYGGINNGGFVELNDLVGPASGIKGVASWSLDVTVKKNGTYTFQSLTERTPDRHIERELEGQEHHKVHPKRRAGQLLCPRRHCHREGSKQVRSTPP